MTTISLEGGSEEQTRALALLMFAALEHPERIDSSAVQICTQLLNTAALPGEVYERALDVLVAAIYWKPDLIGGEVVKGVDLLFSNSSLSEKTYRHACEILTFLLMTPVAQQTINLLYGLLARPDLPLVAYDALLQSLEYAAFWAMARFDLARLVSLAEQGHLAGVRERLLAQVIERATLANPAAVTLPLLQRLIQIYAEHPAFNYCLYYLTCQPSIASTVRNTAESALTGRFLLHDLVASQLGTGAKRILVVQNIADKQGDEIIRLVPLLDGFLRFNPLLEVVLVTAREYLYGHSRIKLVPINDRTETEAVFQQRFDVVIDFYESTVAQVNYDQELEQQLQTYIQKHALFLNLTSTKGLNHFVYQRVDLQSRAYADALGLDRQRVENVYETTFRLLAELGLPLRLGETPPEFDSVLAGLPYPDATKAWGALTAGNTQHRPVALVCPFGGVERLKGYVEQGDNALVERLRGLIREGFYLVVLPNGLPWGSASHARSVVALMGVDEQQHIVIAPDPVDGEGDVTYEHVGTHTVPHASYQMRLVTYFVRFADMIVTVEGWMAHAAYSLGKPYRVLMLSYSHQSAWHPYGRTLHQDIDSYIPNTRQVLPTVPPLPEQPRKLALLFLLKQLGTYSDAGVIPRLRWALGSQDRDVRLAAVEALSQYSDTDITNDLRALLSDPAYRVRAVAATTLLALPDAHEIPREHLLVHQLIGQESRDWAQVIGLGENARRALEIAMRDDDPVVCREAAQVVTFLNRRQTRVASTKRTTLRSTAIYGSMAAALGRVAPVLKRFVQRRLLDRSSDEKPTVLILTPVKDAADCLDGYCRRLRRLTYPHNLISLGFLESDSSDTTFRDLEARMRSLRREFRRVGLWKKDFGYRLPPGTPRWTPAIQVERRGVLARSRNHLLFHALHDETWVLWMDVDVVEYPPDLIERLLATGKQIVQPHCVLEYGGSSFDRNAWREGGRLHLDDLRDEGELVELHAVGGTMLFVRADLHRDGLIFPAFLYGRANLRIRTGYRSDFGGEVAGEIETDGLGMMAYDMGYQCWGMPHLEVLHRRK